MAADGHMLCQVGVDLRGGPQGSPGDLGHDGVFYPMSQRISISPTSVWDSSPNGGVEGLPGSLAFCRKSVFISEMLRTQDARAFWRLLYRVFIRAFPTPPPPQPQARPRPGRPTHPMPAGPAQSGILVDREVVSLFLHFTVNPKPRVDFIDRPRCCLRGKECSINRFQQVESRWGYSGTSDRIR